MSYPPPTNMYEVCCLHQKIEQHLGVVTALDQRINETNRLKQKQIVPSKTLETFVEQVRELGDYLKDIELNPKIKENDEVFKQLATDAHNSEISWAQFGIICYNISVNGAPVDSYESIWYVCSNQGPGNYKAARDTEKYVMTAIEEFDDLLARVIEIKEGKVEELEKFSMSQYLKEENAQAPKDAVNFWVTKFKDECNEVPFSKFQDALFETCERKIVQLDEKYGPGKCKQALTDCFISDPDDNEVDNVEFMLFTQNQSSLDACLETLVVNFYTKQKGSSDEKNQRSLGSPYGAAPTPGYGNGTAPAPAPAPGYGNENFPNAAPPTSYGGYGYTNPVAAPPPAGFDATRAGPGYNDQPPPYGGGAFGYMAPALNYAGQPQPGYGGQPAPAPNYAGQPQGYGGQPAPAPYYAGQPQPGLGNAAYPAYPVDEKKQKNDTYNPNQSYGAPTQKQDKKGNKNNAPPPAGYPGSSSSHSSSSYYGSSKPSKPPKSDYEKAKKKRKKKQKKVGIGAVAGVAALAVGAAIIF